MGTGRGVKGGRVVAEAGGGGGVRRLLKHTLIKNAIVASTTSYAKN